MYSVYHYFVSDSVRHKMGRSLNFGQSSPILLNMISLLAMHNGQLIINEVQLQFDLKNIFHIFFEMIIVVISSVYMYSVYHYFVSDSVWHKMLYC
jgi:hypothetical protein